MKSLVVSQLFLTLDLQLSFRLFWVAKQKWARRVFSFICVHQEKTSGQDGKRVSREGVVQQQPSSSVGLLSVAEVSRLIFFSVCLHDLSTQLKVYDARLSPAYADSCSAKLSLSPNGCFYQPVKLKHLCYVFILWATVGISCGVQASPLISRLTWDINLCAACHSRWTRRKTQNLSEDLRLSDGA